MTIDEAIAHAREVAEEKRRQLEVHWKYEDSLGVNNRLSKKCEKCAEEHEQLAQWLEELKVLRKTTFNYTKMLDVRYEQGREDALDEAFTRTYDKAYEAGYNKACSDFEKEQYEGLTLNDAYNQGKVDAIDEIREPLKKAFDENMIQCEGAHYSDYWIDCFLDNFKEQIE